MYLIYRIIKNGDKMKTIQNRVPFLTLSFVLILALAACTPAGTPTATDSAPTAVPAALSSMPPADCLVGKWQVSNYPEYIASLTNATPSGASGGFTINDHGSSGTIQMNFKTDNSVSFTADQFSESLSMVTNANNTAMEIPIEIKENGTSTSKYSVDGDQISFTDQDQGDFTYEISILGQPSPMDGSLFGSSGSVVVYQYECPNENTLSLKVISIDRDLAPLEFTRVR
jgi:hypothetical protein